MRRRGARRARVSARPTLDRGDGSAADAAAIGVRSADGARSRRPADGGARLRRSPVAVADPSSGDRRRSVPADDRDATARGARARRPPRSTAARCSPRSSPTARDARAVPHRWSPPERRRRDRTSRAAPTLARRAARRRSRTARVLAIGGDAGASRATTRRRSPGPALAPAGDRVRGADRDHRALRPARRRQRARARRRSAAIRRACMAVSAVAGRAADPARSPVVPERLERRRADARADPCDRHARRRVGYADAADDNLTRACAGRWAAMRRRLGHARRSRVTVTGGVALIAQQTGPSRRARRAPRARPAGAARCASTAARRCHAVQRRDGRPTDRRSRRCTLAVAATASTCRRRASATLVSCDRRCDLDRRGGGVAWGIAADRGRRPSTS